MFSLFSLNLFAQNPLSFSKVITVDNMDKEAIYVAARSWFVSAYGDSRSVIEIEDKETGIITGKGLTKYHKKGLTYTCYGGQIKYVIKVQVRDGRYKVDINNIIHDVDLGNAKSCALGLITDSDERLTQGASKKYHNAVVKDIQEKMEVYANSTFENIEKAIASQEEEE